MQKGTEEHISPGYKNKYGHFSITSSKLIRVITEII